MEATPDITPDMLATPEVIADPYPAYKRLRDATPVRYVRLPGGFLPGVPEPVHAWALMRYADVAAALRDHETFSSQTPAAFNFKAMPKLMILHDDPPRHTELRRLVSKAFTPRRVAEMEPFVANLAKELADDVGRGQVDVVSSFAIPLPMKVLAGMLGMPPEDYPTYRRWSEAAVGYTNAAPVDRERNMREMAASFAEVVAARREKGEPDMISALVQAEVDGQALSDAEIASFCTLMLIAGNETTTNLIGNMLHILAERPALWAKVRNDRRLVDSIIDETLRYASPVQRLMRRTTRPVEIAGVTIPAGEIIDVFFGAANRDPEVYADADTFKPDRAADEHVAFGLGLHYCLGAPLARIEARSALNALLDRFPVIAPAASPPVRQRSAIAAFGFKALPLMLGQEGAA